jgi:glycerol-3-phosphate acyltransferase PlsY
MGAIPTGYILVKLLLKEDVRQHGSGNIGATNVLRTGGKKLGVLTYILDMIKIVVPMVLFDLVMNPINDMQSDILLSVLMLIGSAGVFGHMYSCWLKFNGGKGVASFTALCAWLFPYGALLGVLTFAVFAFATRIVSVASLIGVGITSGYVILTAFPELDSPSPLMWVSKIFFIFIVILIFWRHKGNIARLLKGEERKIKL